MDSLIERLGLTDRELIAFVGGGGKSTLTLRLGETIDHTGRRVVITTTTKMGAGQVPAWATPCRTPEEVGAALDRGAAAFLYASIEDEKVIGVTPDVVDTVHATSRATVVVEADGARRRPFKAPGPAEPVIPRRTTLVVVVVGMDALGGRIEDVCHRPERVRALTGREFDDALRPEDVATVAGHPDGGRKNAPAGARVVLALTKVTPEHAAATARIRDMVAPMPVVEIGHEKRGAPPGSCA
jgi:molybdenum cofactor cytidylyltransferase